MNKTRGKFIVIDGTDGSGKTTQLDMLARKLEYFGFKVKITDFPQYNKKSAGLIEEYLEGKYGNLEEVGPYIASIFYACDRYDASFKIKKWLSEGKIVLSNRYVSANLGHQGSKINNPLERKAYYSWISNLEYSLFKNPIPDLTILLHVKAEIAQQLALQNTKEKWLNKTYDIHENRLDHLKKAEAVYLEIASKFKHITTIKCSKNTHILTKNQIHDMVWNKINKFLTY